MRRLTQAGSGLLGLVLLLNSNMAQAAADELNAFDKSRKPAQAEGRVAKEKVVVAGDDRSSEEPRTRWQRLIACAPELQPCTRPRAARFVLAGASVLTATVAGIFFFNRGSRLRWSGDPWPLLGGTSALALAGVGVGAARWVAGPEISRGIQIVSEGRLLAWILVRLSRHGSVRPVPLHWA